MDDITIVTAFFDIGRNSWNDDFKRSADFYIESFLNFLQYPYNMICYIDDRYIETVLDVYANSPYKNKRFIPINQEWLDANIASWKKLHIDKQIIQCYYYKELLENRLRFMYPNGAPEENRRNHLYPENEFPEYNAINHSKIDFIVDSIINGFITTYYTCWCDFGYFNSQHSGDSSTFPKQLLDSNKFHKSKLSFLLKNEVGELDKDMIYTLVVAPEVFTGTFFAGPSLLMLKFQKLYHQCVEELYRNGISDDDQHIYLRCYLKDPDFFDIHVIEGEEWPRGLTFFSMTNDS